MFINTRSDVITQIMHPTQNTCWHLMHKWPHDQGAQNRWGASQTSTGVINMVNDVVPFRASVSLVSKLEDTRLMALKLVKLKDVQYYKLHLRFSSIKLKHPVGKRACWSKATLCSPFSFAWVDGRLVKNNIYFETSFSFIFVGLKVMFNYFSRSMWTT